MALQSSWRPLPLPESPDLPVLLVSMEVEQAAYTVRVTDMANMWTENLDRKAICMRGWGENTTIDPSDTPENMAKFLSSIGSALDPSHPEHRQTHLSLSQASPSDAGEGGLTLKITCRLPGLEPLKWPLHLRKSPPSRIATYLVLPLVQAQNARAREIQSLCTMLANKDAVLTKVLDKLEATGTGLEHVFNALSGKKKVNRAVADSRVKGLAPFQLKQWQNDMDNEDGPDSATSLIHDVFTADGLRHGGSLDIGDSPELDNWWKALKGSVQAVRRDGDTHKQTEDKPQSPPQDVIMEDADDDFQVQATPPHLASKPKTKPSKNAPSDDDDFQTQATPPQVATKKKRHVSPKAQSGDDDDFQTQATPPHLTSKSKQKSTKAAPADDASTDSGDDDDDVPPVSLSSDKKPSSRSPAKPKAFPSGSKLGVIGGKKQSKPEPAVTAQALPEPSHAGDDDATASDTASEVSDDEKAWRTVPSPQPTAAKQPAPPKGRLGRIGGKNTKPDAKPNEPAVRGDDKPETIQDVPSPRKPRLGMIGKWKDNKSSTVTTTNEDTTRGRLPSRETKPKDEPRETSTERADRRREELKRELERKAAAGPTKKKRKF